MCLTLSIHPPNTQTQEEESWYPTLMSDSQQKCPWKNSFGTNKLLSQRTWYEGYDIRTFSRGYYQNEALKLILTDLGERSDENELSVLIRRPQCTVWYDWSRHFDRSSGKPGRPVRLCYIGLEHTAAAESCMLVLELTCVTWQLLRAHTGSGRGPLLFSLYKPPFGHVLRLHNGRFHSYTDDTQLSVPAEPNDATAVSSITNCLLPGSKHISTNFLKLHKQLRNSDLA